MVSLRIHGVELARKGEYVVAYQILREAANNGDVLAYNDLGVMAEKMGDYKLALDCYRIAHKANVMVATRNIGNMYKQGLGVEQDYKKAIRYFTKAAKGGYAPAFDDLSMMAEEGLGMEKSDEKAFNYLLEGVEYDFKDDMALTNNIAYCYERGIGTPVDLKKAFYYYKKAAKYGNPCAAYNLGLCYLLGKGVKADISKGTDLLMYAAEKNYPDAYYQLFHLYYDGKLVNKNNELAFYYIFWGMKLESPRAHLAYAEIMMGNDNPYGKTDDVKGMMSVKHYLETFMDDSLNVERYEDFKNAHPDYVDWTIFEKNPTLYINDVKSGIEA